MNKNKVNKESKLTYSELCELFDEASSELCNYIRLEQDMSKELTYLKDFIRFKKLEKEYAYFYEHAIEDPDEDLPFPHLILK